jgi:hypothetical protein
MQEATSNRRRVVSVTYRDKRKEEKKRKVKIRRKQTARENGADQRRKK